MYALRSRISAKLISGSKNSETADLLKCVFFVVSYDRIFEFVLRLCDLTSDSGGAWSLVSHIGFSPKYNPAISALQMHAVVFFFPLGFPWFLLPASEFVFFISNASPRFYSFFSHIHSSIFVTSSPMLCRVFCFRTEQNSSVLSLCFCALFCQSGCCSPLSTFG